MTCATCADNADRLTELIAQIRYRRDYAAKRGDVRTGTELAEIVKMLEKFERESAAPTQDHAK